MKTYILNYHWALPADMLGTLEKAGIDEWLQIWPGMVLFKGEKDQAHYADKIRELNKATLFMVTKYDPKQSVAWMPPTVWDWLRPNAQPITPAATQAAPLQTR